MTVARPLAAFLSALTAGVIENFFNPPAADPEIQASRACPVDNCCDGSDCPDKDHKNHHSFFAKVAAGIRYAVNDLWGDLAGWFFVGILLAGIISALLPNDIISVYLGGGLSSMLLMLVIGIPLYICATASTPIAAAFIVKGMSPGTALVFLLAGPATNITSLSVLIGILGKRAAGIYLAAISLVSVICGLALDMFYFKMGIKASAVAGQAADIIPWPIKLAAVIFLLAISVKPLWRITINILTRKRSCCTDSGQPPTPFPLAK